MSFSGLKTSLVRACDGLDRHNGKLGENDIADLCAGFQAAITGIILEKSNTAFEAYVERTGQRANAFAVCGGVAANQTIRAGLNALCSEKDAIFIAPEPQYCTDNGAMIAWAGIERYRLGLFDDFNLPAHPRWPLDTESPPLVGFGKRGAKS